MNRLFSSGSSDDVSVLIVKDLSACLVDCTKTSGLDAQPLHQVAEQSYPSIEVELEEDDEQLKADTKINLIDLEPNQQLQWRQSERDDRDSNTKGNNPGEINRLQLSHTAGCWDAVSASGRWRLRSEKCLISKHHQPGATGHWRRGHWPWR